MAVKGTHLHQVAEAVDAQDWPGGLVGADGGGGSGGRSVGIGVTRRQQRLLHVSDAVPCWMLLRCLCGGRM